MIGQEWSWLGGKVTYDGYNLPGVLVRIRISSDTSYSLYTDENGNYGFKDLTPGTYIVTFSKEGYWDKSVSKTLLGGENNLDVSMVPTWRPDPRKLSIAIGVIGGLALILLVVVKKKEGIKR